METRQEPQTGGAAPANLYDRMPPQDTDAERAVLGAMLMRTEAIGTAVEILHHDEQDVFFIPAHQIIYDVIISLFNENKPLDRVVLIDEITRRDALEKIGGESYLAELVNVVPTSANVEYYAKIVLEKSLRRRLIDSCARITVDAYQGKDVVEELLDGAEKQIFALNEQRQTNRIYAVSELLEEGVDRIEKQIKSGDSITGLRTSFKEMDLKLSGLQPADMIVLAARPSVGKTAFALNIAANAATRDGKCVLLFSLEMAKEQLVQRLLCLVGGVDSDRLRNGFLADAEFVKVQEAAGKLNNAKIYIDESAGLTPLELRSKARRQSSLDKIDLVIIDYMQLMHTSGRNENRQTEMSEISRAIKGLARELHVPVMTLSQLSREAEKDDKGTPKLSHLRESGAIEQDADVVIILSRPPAADRENRDNVIIANIAKQRNGPTGRFEMLFQANKQRFRDFDSSSVDECVPESPKNVVPINNFDPIYDEPYEEDDEDIPFD
ncbi:MAG: replicative DNA helicase [Candidatus Hydrogenedentes bacterium]|nr:replicative DNA helicase [Candidatus Hydrogenedentota bacterium]